MGGRTTNTAITFALEPEGSSGSQVNKLGFPVTYNKSGHAHIAKNQLPG